MKGKVMEELRFSLKLKEQPIVLTDENGGDIKMVMREMSGKARDAYMTKLQAKVSFDPNTGKLTEIKDMGGLEGGLLSLCLFYENGNQPVPEGEIEEWPSSVRTKLVEVARKINGLDDETAGSLGND